MAAKPHRPAPDRSLSRIAPCCGRSPPDRSAVSICLTASAAIALRRPRDLKQTRRRLVRGGVLSPRRKQRPNQDAKRVFGMLAGDLLDRGTAPCRRFRAPSVCMIRATCAGEGAARRRRGGFGAAVIPVSAEAFRQEPPARSRRQDRPSRSCVSVVALAMCGISITFSSASRSGCTSRLVLVDVERGTGDRAVP